MDLGAGVFSSSGGAKSWHTATSFCSELNCSNMNSPMINSILGLSAGTARVVLLAYVPHPNLIGVKEPVMEDWGWYACVKTRDTGVAIQVLVYSWPFLEDCWMIGLEAQQAFFGRHSPEAISKAIDCAADAIDDIIRVGPAN